jgi:hypothetical protein
MSNGRRALSTQAVVAAARVTKPAAPRRQTLIAALTGLANEIDALLDDMGTPRHGSSGHRRAARRQAGGSNRRASALRTRN